MYPSVQNRQQVGDDFNEITNHPQVGDDSMRLIFNIPWGHNKIIIDKCKGDVIKALFYVRRTIENNWSRDVLLNFLDTNLYKREGKAITNFMSPLVTQTIKKTIV